MDTLTAAEQRELQSRMERKQMQQFMSAYQNFVQRCFDDCISDFASKSLSSREEGCVMRCIDKQMKGSERVGLRFQEQNSAMMQGGGLPK